MAKMGRPKATEPRNNAVMVRFTDAEYLRLKKYAELANLTLADTIRKELEKTIQSKP